MWNNAHEIIARHAHTTLGGGRARATFKKAKALIEDPENQLYFSAASLWEISIKNKLGRTDFKVNSAHTIGVDALPNIHKDPFDRMLVAQTAVEGITLMTADSVVVEYPVAVVRVN